MNIRIETITPDMAQNWLNANNSNRKLREGLVERYADDMKNGRWTNCPEPISFYEDGDIADGQHRLYGIVEADIPVAFPVARGLKREDGLNINTGAGRSVVDAARISGLDTKLTTELVSVARAIEQGVSTNRQLSNSERLEMVERHREAATWTISNGPHGRGLRNAPVMAAVARAWYYETDKERLKQFGKVFSTGFVENGEDDTAAIALRNYFLTKKGLIGGATWVDTFLKAQNAISYFMRSKPLTVIRAVKDEAYPLKKAKK